MPSSVHKYIPHTKEDIEAMLKEIGVSNIDDLFSSVPEPLKLKKHLDLPQAASELELLDELNALSSQNADFNRYTSFLGGGVYNHYIPTVINHILTRGEFYTAYTPYQPEVSQGTLQAIFEFQTMICEITGMDVANASMYDAGTAVAEAAILATSSKKRNKIVVTRTTNPRYRDVLKTYAKYRGLTVVEVDFDHGSGTTNINDITSAIDGDVACVIAQNPNFFGNVEDMDAIGKTTHEGGGLFIAVVNPMTLALLTPPGSYDADIAVGEGQSLGNSTSFGGPLLGFFAAKNDLVRKLPGRLVGETKDAKGRRGFVLTIQTREQHIRRENATSNICSNEALCALAATIYLSVMGPQGFKEVAELSLKKAHYLQKKLSSVKGFSSAFTAPFFNEFVVKSDKCSCEINSALLKKGFLGGRSLTHDYPELKGHTLWCATEVIKREEIDSLIAEMEVLA